MKPNEQPKSKILIALLRVALSEAIRPSDVALFTGDTPWEEVYRFSAAQGVMALAWDGLMRLQSEGLISQEQMPSRAIKLQWALGVERAERRYETQKQALTKLAKIYNREGIRGVRNRSIQRYEKGYFSQSDSAICHIVNRRCN